MVDKAVGHQYVRPIDYDRGVIIKMIGTSGMEVFMYRKDPGVYYTAHGSEVNVALARMAGFDVDRHLARRQHILRSRLASEVIAREEGVSDGVGKHVTVEEAAGFKLVDIGLGRYWVEDEHGPLNKGTHLTREMAQVVFNACIGEVRKGAAETPAPVLDAGAGRGKSVGVVGAAKAP